MYNISARRISYLTRCVIHDGRIINGLNIVSVNADGDAVIEPFDIETHTTAYHDAPVAVVRADAVTDMLIDDLVMLRRDPARILRYLQAADLFANSGSGACLLPL